LFFPLLFFSFFRHWHLRPPSRLPGFSHAAMVGRIFSHLNFLLVILWLIILMKRSYHSELLSIFFGGNYEPGRV
jgi:hypothetical protein